VGERMSEDTMFGVIDLRTSLLEAGVWRLGFERVVHPHMCFQRILIRQQTWAILDGALFLLETIITVIILVV